MKSRPIHPRPHFPPLSLISPYVFLGQFGQKNTFLALISSFFSLRLLSSSTSLLSSCFHLGLTSFSLRFSSTHFILGIPSLTSHLGIHFRPASFFSLLFFRPRPRNDIPDFSIHKSLFYRLPTILIYLEIHNAILRIPSKVILNNILIDRDI